MPRADESGAQAYASRLNVAYEMGYALVLPPGQQVHEQCEQISCLRVSFHHAVLGNERLIEGSAHLRI